MRDIQDIELSKKLLRAVLCLKSTSFVRHMNDIYPDLIDKYPRYNKRRHTLDPEVFFWICHDKGLNVNMIKERIFDYYNVNMDAEKAKIVKCFGLHSPLFIDPD